MNSVGMQRDCALSCNIQSQKTSWFSQLLSNL